MAFRYRAAIALVLRLLLGAVFVWAGTVKILDSHDFLVSLYSYEIELPETFLRLVAVILPWIEVICGLVVILGIWQDAGLDLISLLLVIFILATGQAWVRGLEISCGCFGSRVEETTFLGSVGFAFLRNLALLFFAVYLRHVMPHRTSVREA